MQASSRVWRLRAESEGGREAIMETLKQELKSASWNKECVGTGRDAWGDDGQQEARWLLILRLRGVVHWPI